MSIWGKSNRKHERESKPASSPGRYKEGKGRWGGRILEKEMKDGVFSEQGDL